MDFEAAAEATWAELEDSDIGAVVEAFCDGVNRHLGDPPAEVRLLGYEPDAWTPVDCMLAEKQIAWGLTGSFRTLRKETLAAALGSDVAKEVIPDRLDHDAAIVGHGPGGDVRSASADASDVASNDADGRKERRRPATPPGATCDGAATDPDLESWLSGFESPPEVGSNS